MRLLTQDMGGYPKVKLTPRVQAILMRDLLEPVPWLSDEYADYQAAVASHDDVIIANPTRFYNGRLHTGNPANGPTHFYSSERKMPLKPNLLAAKFSWMRPLLVGQT